MNWYSDGPYDAYYQGSILSLEENLTRHPWSCRVFDPMPFGWCIGEMK